MFVNEKENRGTYSLQTLQNIILTMPIFK